MFLISFFPPRAYKHIYFCLLSGCSHQNKSALLPKLDVGVRLTWRVFEANLSCRTCPGFALVREATFRPKSGGGFCCPCDGMVRWNGSKCRLGSVLPLVCLDYAIVTSHHGGEKKNKKNSKASAASPTAAGRGPRSYCRLRLYKKNDAGSVAWLRFRCQMTFK